jgi:putative transposase
MIMLRWSHFFRTLKVEEVYMFEYDNFEEALEGITHFIEKVYNSKRLHSSLDYMSPEEFEYNFNNKIRTRQLVLT